MKVKGVILCVKVGLVGDGGATDRHNRFGFTAMPAPRSASYKALHALHDVGRQCAFIIVTTDTGTALIKSQIMDACMQSEVEVPVAGGQDIAVR